MDHRLRRIAALVSSAGVPLLLAAVAGVGPGAWAAEPVRPVPVPALNDSVIRLDTADPTFDAWKTRRDLSQDPKREPGPINLDRWPGRFGWGGVPTFYGLPAAITVEDLKAGDIDVAIFGAPLDFSSGQRGCAFGPQALRTSEKYLPSGKVVVNPEVGVQIDPFAVLKVVDYGDGPVDIYSIERTVPAMREFVREIAGAGVIPVTIGGDHSLMWPDAAALQDVYGRGAIGVIHFDAHFDGGSAGFGHVINHGMPVRRLIDTEKFPGKNFVQVGLRGYYPDSETLEWMRSNGIRAHFMNEIEAKGWNRVLEQVIREAATGTKYVFLSLDIDVLDPAFTPGTGTPEPGGLTTRELFPILRRICAETEVVGIEIVEFNPLADPGYTTALNVNRCLREMLTGIAMRRSGIKTPNYLDPRTSGKVRFPR